MKTRIEKEEKATKEGAGAALAEIKIEPWGLFLGAVANALPPRWQSTAHTHEKV